MNPVLDTFLCEKFPAMYRDRHGAMNSTAMCWGFSCGDGWFPLLFDLSQEITGILTRIDAEGGPKGTKVTKEIRESAVENFRVVQVKEKFGTLRFYTNSVYGEIDEAISRAEDRSSKTCEECGEPGVLRGTHWFKTTCNKHANGALPVGCEMTKATCDKGTVGCVTDHKAEEAKDNG